MLGETEVDDLDVALVIHQKVLCEVSDVSDVSDVDDVDDVDDVSDVSDVSDRVRQERFYSAQTVLST